MLSAADRELRLGMWKIHILHHAASREVWGRWLLEELAEHGHALSPGTLYPALLRMEANGWLQRTGNATHPRARQTFRISRQGRRLLDSIRRDVAELYEEVVLGREPEHLSSATKPAAQRQQRRAQRGARTAKSTVRRRPS